MGETLRTTYECTGCGVTSDVTVSDLWAGLPDSTPEMKAAILKRRADRELTYATCPRCGARNPAGIFEQTKLNRAIRGGYISFFGLLGIGIYFLPALAWLLVAINAILVLVIVYALRRVGANLRAKMNAALTVLVLAGMIAAAIYYPRWVSLFALVLVVQFVRKTEKADEPWENAKAKIVWAEPYR